jgi:hypothetical protein
LANGGAGNDTESSGGNPLDLSFRAMDLDSSSEDGDSEGEGNAKKADVGSRTPGLGPVPLMQPPQHPALVSGPVHAELNVDGLWSAKCAEIDVIASAFRDRLNSSDGRQRFIGALRDGSSEETGPNRDSGLSPAALRILSGDRHAGENRQQPAATALLDAVKSRARFLPTAPGAAPASGVAAEALVDAVALPFLRQSVRRVAATELAAASAAPVGTRPGSLLQHRVIHSAFATALASGFDPRSLPAGARHCIPPTPARLQGAFARRCVACLVRRDPGILVAPSATPFAAMAIGRAVDSAAAFFRKRSLAAAVLPRLKVVCDTAAGTSSLPASSSVPCRIEVQNMCLEPVVVGLALDDLPLLARLPLEVSCPSNPAAFNGNQLRTGLGSLTLAETTEGCATLSFPPSFPALPAVPAFVAASASERRGRYVFFHLAAFDELALDDDSDVESDIESDTADTDAMDTDEGGSSQRGGRALPSSLREFLGPSPSLPRSIRPSTRIRGRQNTCVVPATARFGLNEGNDASPSFSQMQVVLNGLVVFPAALMGLAPPSSPVAQESQVAAEILAMQNAFKDIAPFQVIANLCQG